MLRGSYGRVESTGSYVGAGRFRRSVGTLKGIVGRKRYVSRKARVIRDPVVQRQLRLGMTQWCEISHESSARLIGTTNQQLIQTYSTGVVDPYLNPITSESGDIAHVRLLDEATRNCNPAAISDSLVVSVYQSAPGANPVDASPRTTWDMGTCWQLRDMLAYCYNFHDALGSRVGYRQPYARYTAGPLVECTEQHPAGVPNIFNSQRIAYPRYNNPYLSTTHDETYATNFNIPGTTQQRYQYRMMQLQKRCPMHVQYEEMQFSFFNPSETKQHVTIYECILKQDVPLVEWKKAGAVASIGLLDEVKAIPIGAVPHPRELWRDYMTYVDTKGHMTHVPNQDQYAQDGLVDEEEAIRATLTDHEAAGVAEGVNVFNDAGVSGDQLIRMAMNKSINTPGMRPMGPLIHRWYKIVPHKVTLEAGSRQTLSIRLNYNGCPRWHDIMENYGVRNRTRVLMMVVKGERMVGKKSTEPAGTLNIASVVSKPDVLCTWKRSMKFCRYNLKPERMTIDVRVPTRTDIDKVYQVDEEEGDFEEVVDQC